MDKFMIDVTIGEASFKLNDFKIKENYLNNRKAH